MKILSIILILCSVTIAGSPLYLDLKWDPRNSEKYISYNITIEDEAGNFSTKYTDLKELTLNLEAGVIYEIILYGIDENGNEFELSVMQWASGGAKGFFNLK